MLAFVLAVFLLLVTPGPGVLSLAGVGAAFGWRQGISYFFGLFIGNNLVCIAVISGVATVILANSFIRVILSVMSAAYLGYFAFRIAFSGAKIAFIQMPKPSLVTGTTIQLINPKAYAVHMTLFSGFAFYPNDFFIETAVKFLMANVIWILIHFLWLYLGIKINQLGLPEKIQRIINVFMAISLLVVVSLSVWSMIHPSRLIVVP